MIFRYLYGKRQLENCLKEYYITIILLSINHHHTNPQMLYMNFFVCTFHFPLSKVFHSLYPCPFLSSILNKSVI